MKLKLDENLPAELADDLAVMGHDDTVADEGLCGAPDPLVVEAASAAGRILLTLDKGIGDLRNYPVEAHGGVILFRPDATGRQAVRAFARGRIRAIAELEIYGRLAVVSRSRIRFR